MTTLSELKALHEKATKGPWTYFHDTCGQCKKEGAAEYGLSGPPGGYHAQFSHEPDIAFIVEAHKIFPALIACAEALQFMASQISDPANANHKLGAYVLGTGVAMVNKAIAMLEETK